MYLAADREATADEPIQHLHPPGKLVIPLVQQNEAPAERIVKLDETVARGSMLARAVEAGGANVHAPTAGKVTAVTRVDTAYATDVPAIEITPTDTPEKPPSPANRPASNTMTSESLSELAWNMGVVDGCEKNQSLAAMFEQARSISIQCLIINGLDSEPMLSTNHRLILEQLKDLVETVIAIKEAFSIGRVCFVFDRREPDVARRVREATKSLPIQPVGVYHRYPLSSPVLLTHLITGMETPYGYAPLDIGSFVLDLSSVATLTEALHGQAMTSKLLTVTGPCAAAPGNYRVPIGMRISDIIVRVGLAEPLARVVAGGPLTGTSINTLDTVITKHTRGIVLANAELAKPPRPGPCIRCGWCQQDCPVGLDPAAILDIVERRTHANAAAQRPLACLECGLCSYVCPSELPLARAVSQLKQFIKQENATSQGTASTR